MKETFAREEGGGGFDPSTELIETTMRSVVESVSAEVTTTTVKEGLSWSPSSSSFLLSSSTTSDSFSPQSQPPTNSPLISSPFSTTTINSDSSSTWPWKILSQSASTSGSTLTSHTTPPTSTALTTRMGNTIHNHLELIEDEESVLSTAAASESSFPTVFDADIDSKQSYFSERLKNFSQVEIVNELWNGSSFFPFNNSTKSSGFNLPQSLPLTSLNQDYDANDSIGTMDNLTFQNGSDYNSTWPVDTDDISKNYWALLMIIFPLVTVFGNVLVILSVKRERSLWNVTNYFIVSLAVADLLVAAVVMPFAVYLLFNNLEWGLAPIFCDFYIAMDVTCSTSSILNLVAISIDRFIAVTQPIKYAKHKSNTRVWVTILFVWVFSGLVGSPIVLGLNSTTEPAAECTFNNKYFVLFSSLCSFYIPCAILVVLYYRIFKVIRERAKKAQGGRKPAGNTKGSTVIENIAQTKRLAETALGGPSSLPVPKTSNLEDEKCTNTGSGSQEDPDELDKEDVDLDGDAEGDGDGDGEIDVEDASPDSDDCHIIANNQAATAFVLESVKDDERVTAVRPEANGNHDSGYAASNMEEGVVPVLQEPSPASPKHATLVPPDQCKRNGLTQTEKEGETSGTVTTIVEASSSKKSASRFTIGKVNKSSRKKREKSSAKRERKATKTLAIVLGLFLACWLPFFTCNLMDALCSILNKRCSPGMVAFLMTTWLGYVNSCLNPVIYTIFNPEFRKAFKKIMGFGP